MNDKNNNFPEKGTPEFHLRMLKKLQRWLSINPKNNPLVADEAVAVQWAIDELESSEKDNG